MNKRILTSAGIALFLFTSYAAIAGNETVLPPALVFLLLCLIGLISSRAAVPPEADNPPSGKAAHYAIVSFAILMAALSILVSLFLPAVAVRYGITGLFDGDFVRVSINDAHELAYSTCLLLIFDIIFLARYGRTQNWVPRTDGHARISKSV